MIILYHYFPNLQNNLESIPVLGRIYEAGNISGLFTFMHLFMPLFAWMLFLIQVTGFNMTSFTNLPDLIKGFYWLVGAGLSSVQYGLWLGTTYLTYQEVFNDIDYSLLLSGVWA